MTAKAAVLQDWRHNRGYQALTALANLSHAEIIADTAYRAGRYHGVSPSSTFSTLRKYVDMFCYAGENLHRFETKL